MTTNIYPNNALLSNLKKQIILTSIVGLLALSFISSAQGQNSAKLGLYEDEALVCIKDVSDGHHRGAEICRIVDILDLLTEKQQKTLFKDFNEYNDVFDIESLD